MTQAAVVRKLKFDGSVRYEWDGEVVEELPGWVVVLHDHARHEKRDSKPVAGESTAGFGLHYVGLVEPVTVLFWFDAAGRFIDAKCDAALPATKAGATIDFVDLDLDVVVRPGFQHYIRDQDVFAERSVSMGYSEEAKRTAHLGILHTLRMVRRHQFPFDGHADRLIAQLTSGAAAQGMI